MAALPRVTTDLQILEASRVTIHPNFEARPDLNAYFFDVAVLTVPGLGLPALPIAAFQKNSAGELGAVYGFGINDQKSSGTLVSGQITLSEVTENHIISAYDGSGANPCFGDSGGPLVRSFIGAQGEVVVGIIGVVSSGSLLDCSEGDTTLYTSMANPVVAAFVSSVVPDVLFF